MRAYHHPGYLNPQRLFLCLENVMNMLDDGRDLVCCRVTKNRRPRVSTLCVKGEEETTTGRRKTSIRKRESMRLLGVEKLFPEFPLSCFEFWPETFHRISSRLSFCSCDS